MLGPFHGKQTYAVTDTVMCPSDSILFSTLALKTIQEVRLESDD